jgi:nucleotide-binding universal stress UspA family protein
VSIKDILVYLQGVEAALPAIDFATSLALQTGAHLTAAAIAIEYPPLAAGPSIGGMGFAGIQALQNLARENRKALERAGAEFVAGAPSGLQAEFTLIQGYRGEACQAFARQARYFDLSVIGQGRAENGGLDRRVVAETLFGSGRPIFIVPFIHKGPAKLERAMICWDGGLQAARALAAAMPLLKLSRNVEAVTIGGVAAAEADLSIAQHLARHGVSVTLTTLPAADEAGDALLSYAADRSADYLIMGGYGHWRLSEFVLGGTTRTILGAMTIPVLMAH